MSQCEHDMAFFPPYEGGVSQDDLSKKWDFFCGHPIQPLRPSPGISSVPVKGEEVSQKCQAKPGHLKSCIWHISDTWCIRRHRDEQDGLEEGKRQGGNPRCGAGINTNHWQQRRSSGTKHERGHETASTRVKPEHGRDCGVPQFSSTIGIQTQPPAAFKPPNYWSRSERGASSVPVTGKYLWGSW